MAHVARDTPASEIDASERAHKFDCCRMLVLKAGGIEGLHHIVPKVISVLTWTGATKPPSEGHGFVQKRRDEGEGNGVAIFY